MTNKNFLDAAGVSRLWHNITKAISGAVISEKERAIAEEKRIEQKITDVAGHAYVEGDGINITINKNGEKVISLEEGAISDEHIESISISKLTSAEGQTVVFNGGNANG
jgi:uncharacterized protein YlxW (UPF0749 family)